MTTMRAFVEWIPKEQGGRVLPPAGVGSPSYATVVRFRDDDASWPPPIAWSLVVEKVEALSEHYKWIADVYFLVSNAPHESLRPGRQFELFEGSRCVARGKILEDCNADLDLKDCK